MKLLFRVCPNLATHRQLMPRWRMRGAKPLLPLYTFIACIGTALSFLGEYAKLRKMTVSFVMSVRLSAWKNSPPTGRIFMKFDIWVFFGNLPRKFKFHENRTRITGTLHEDQCTLLISHSFLLRMKNVSDKNYMENRNTHFVFNPDLANNQST